MVATAIIGSAVVGAVASSSASKSAAKAQTQAADAATAEQQRQYDQTREDYAPYRESGYAALDQINALNAGDYSSFQASPDYEWTRSEGQRGVERSAAAKGGAFSGNALKALSEYNQGLASQQYNSYYNKIAGVAGIGQSATNSTTQAGQTASNNISQNYLYSGDARASGITGSANGVSNSVNTGLNNWLLYKGGYFG